MKYLRVIGFPGFFLNALLGITPAFAQKAPAPRVAGTVITVDAPANRISVQPDKGDAVAISTTDRTVILRIPAGENDVRKGDRIAISGIAPGDRIVAAGEQPDPKSLEARSILVMSRADVDRMRQKDREDWQKRGTTGTVSAIDPAAKTLTLKVGGRDVAVATGEKTGYRRYSPDSARFADSKPSAFDQIQPGDQARILGDKSPDGSSVTAERIVFGTFRQIAATVTSLDAQTGQLEVKDLASKKPLTIRVNADTAMRRLPEMMAGMLARRYQSGAAEGRGGRGGEAPVNPAGRGAGRGGNGDIGPMLDRLPAMALAELKPGDAIMVSTTAGTDPGRVTAVTLLAGVEPLLTASPAATRDIMGGWNLGSGGDTENQQ
jgi:hypothetical protein